MDTGIGATLREARNRRKADLAEVEAATKIRARYLRAMEHEEWDALPGSAYTRGFIRAYASYLGLDGERLAEDFLRETGSRRVETAPRVEPAKAGRGVRRESRLSSRAIAAAVVVALIGALVAIGVAGGGNGGPTGAPEGAAPGGGGGAVSRGTGVEAAPAPATAPGVSVRIVARGEVWVCLLDAGGRALVEGRVLEAGAAEGPFRSRGFTVAFGNGEVSMRVDGDPAGIPATPDPLGYEIDPEGSLTPLAEGERPTCT